MLQLKNNFYKVLLALVSLFIWNNYAHSQNIFISKTNQKIWEAKDRSDVVYTLYILKKGNNAEKLLALKGLLSWHDSSFRKPLLKLVRKGNQEINIAALGAIGQSRDSFYCSYLIKIINHKKLIKIKPSALIALGKCVTKSKVELIKRIKNIHQSGYAECVYRAMLKGVGAPVLTDNMLKILMSTHLEERFYAAWYLSRTPFTLNLEQCNVVLQKLKEEALNSYTPNHDISSPLIIALGKAKLNFDSLPSLAQIIWHFKYPRANTEALKAIAFYKALLPYKEKLDSGLIWMMKADSKYAYPSVQLAYSELMANNCKDRERKENITYAPALVNLIKSTSCKNRQYKLPITNTIYDQIWKLQLLETDFQNYPIINNVLMQNANPAVKSAAMESLIKCRMLKNFPDNLVSDFNESVSILIKDGDEGVLSIIANAILDKQISLEENYKVLLMEAQSKLKLPIEMEAYLDIEKVKAMINGKPYKKPEAEWNHPIEWDYLSKIKTDQKVKVTTNQGEFIIQMNVNEAPGSVSSILKLIEDGFYNGKFFHRMVPNFVVQGGCPRGDGFGGVDYTIRSEFSSLKYSTGAVGLASSGPNTESCQWFFTHCPTPHLDGRYTIIGYVVEGMEIINKLGVGDKMLKVERL